MRFYTKQHRFYCGVDHHARTMSICILDQAGAVVLERSIAAKAELFLKVIAPFRDDLIVGCECMFAWYWLCDRCAQEQVAFVLGHAYYMKAIHGGKAKNDKIDADKIARLLRGGNFPLAYAYPAGMRETRDLLRRRMYLVHKRAEAIGHIQNTNSQYNLPEFGEKLIYASNRAELKIADRFTDASVRKSIEIDLALVDALDPLILDVERHLIRHAKIHDTQMFHRLRTVPGVGPILALTLLYEIHDIHRFADVGHFLSYTRLVRCSHESANKKKGSGGKKIGNAHLRWAFGELVCLFLRESDRAKTWMQRQQKKRGKPKAIAILAAKLARVVYGMWRKQEAFDEKRFWAC